MEDKAYQWEVKLFPPKETDIERIYAYHRGTDVTGLKVEKAREYAQRDGKRYAVVMVKYYEKPIVVLESDLDEIEHITTSIVAIINEDGSIA